jgi:hypothetical protein
MKKYINETKWHSEIYKILFFEKKKLNTTKLLGPQRIF